MELMSRSRPQRLVISLRRLVGWRSALLALSIVPTLLLTAWLLDSWWKAVMLAGAVTIPIGVSLLIASVDTIRNEHLLDRLLGTGRRVPSDINSLSRRVEVLDKVVSSEGRRPWEPTTLPQIMVPRTEPKPILLLPGADYHLPETFAIADELSRRRVPNIVSVGIPHWQRTGDGLNWYDRTVYATPTPEEVGERFSAVVAMKDWAGYAPLVEAANNAGLPTFAKVEGAQDFHDVDTGSPRNPYRTARHILCQGQNDYDALSSQQRTIVGSTRLERLWWAPPAYLGSPLAIINLNFTYGVLTDARDYWLRTAIEGCEAAGLEFVISVHPAEKARTPNPKATSVSASRLMRHATVLVSRFSTLPYEAMARGVPFVYHNPHREAVSAFSEPAGAFQVSNTSAELATALGHATTVGAEVRQMSAAFFRQQVDIDDLRSSESRACDVILAPQASTPVR